MLSSFKFHPVGQGCFYSGYINEGDKEFVIVYDCGTVSPYNHLSTAIANFKRRHNKIDILIVSHFDKDHVNGIKELLSGIQCELVVIPYYSELVRLILMGKNEYDTDYLLFLRDPVRYLLEAGAKRVIVLEGDDEILNDENRNNPNNPKDDVKNVLFDAIKPNQKLIEKVKEEKDFVENENVKYTKLPMNLVTVGIWEFIFYVKEFNAPTEMASLKQEIDDLISKMVDKSIKSLFDPVFHPNVNKLYKKYFKDINLASISVYHSPIVLPKSRAIFVECYPHRCSKSETVGTLLTGDSNLKIDFPSFTSYYSSKISNCFLLQVPHHGSAASWEDFPNSLDNIDSYVINHGFMRKKHPNNNVIANILLASNSKKIISNHEYNPVQYWIVS